MANTLYPKYRQALLAGGVNLSTGAVKAVLIDLGAYTYSAAHQFLSDVPSAARFGTPQTLANKTITNGNFDADDVTFPAVAAGASTGGAVEAVLFYRDSGAEAASELIYLMDTGVTGLPLTLNGSPVKITFDAAGIFQL
jgi:hypothetical protein